MPKPHPWLTDFHSGNDRKTADVLESYHEIKQQAQFYPSKQIHWVKAHAQNFHNVWCFLLHRLGREAEGIPDGGNSVSRMMGIRIQLQQGFICSVEWDAQWLVGRAVDGAQIPHFSIPFFLKGFRFLLNPCNCSIVLVKFALVIFF